MSQPTEPIAVPALDLKAQYQSIRDEIEHRGPPGDREPVFHPRPGGRGVRGRGGRLLRVGARGRLRVGVGRAAAAPDGPGDRAGRRGHHHALHLLRHRRRRSGGPGPGRSSSTSSPTPTTSTRPGSRPRSPRRTQGDHPGPPLRPVGRHGPDQRDRRAARPARARGRRPGDRRRLSRAAAPGRSATSRRSASTRRRTSAASATPGWSRPTTRRLAKRWPGSASTGWSRSTTTTRSASTRGSTPSRPPCSASSSATSTPGPRPAASVADRYRAPLRRRRAWTSVVTLPVERAGQFHVYNQFVDPRRRPTSATRSAAAPDGAAGSAPRSTTRSRSTCSPASPRWATSPATSPSPRPPPARRSPCRCTPS